VGLGNDTLLLKSLVIKDKFAVDELYEFTYDTIYVKNDKFTYSNKENTAKIIDINVRSPIKRKDGRDYFPMSVQIFFNFYPMTKLKLTELLISIV
jgi:hypothetical protein